MALTHQGSNSASWQALKIVPEPFGEQTRACATRLIMTCAQATLSMVLRLAAAAMVLVNTMQHSSAHELIIACDGI